MFKDIARVYLIGTAPVGLTSQREGKSASSMLEHSGIQCVIVQSIATNAWNQNFNTGNEGNQNNNNKTNANRARAARRPGGS